MAGKQGKTFRRYIRQIKKKLRQIEEYINKEKKERRAQESRNCFNVVGQNDKANGLCES